MLDKNDQAGSLCNFLQSLSSETWERIEFVHTRNGLKVFETTITQNILYKFYKYSESLTDASIQMFEAYNEPTNGNDIELILQTKQGWVIIPLQSKIVYKNGKYGGMGNGAQKTKLINYAKRCKGIPLYLLYNYSYNFIHSDNIDGINFSEKQFGCSLVNTYGLHGKKTSFLSLHPSIGIPWFVLGLQDKGIDLMTKNDKSEIQFYSYGNLMRDDKWKPFKIQGGDTRQDLYNNDQLFCPRYRIILPFQNN